MEKSQINNQNNALDNEGTLIYVHIGKCGGSSLWQVIPDSPLLKKRFNNVTKVHISKPPIFNKASYLIVLRNPIKRAISAFNWRYKLVVERSLQRTRFEGEFEILSRYKTVNNLSEALYTNGVLNISVAEEFRTIHHLKEDIAFYMSELLSKVKKEQIFGVLCAETLDEDIIKVLGVNPGERIHENATLTPPEKKHLTSLAYANLKNFLEEDYASINKLLDFNYSTTIDKARLLA